MAEAEVRQEGDGSGKPAEQGAPVKDPAKARRTRIRVFVVLGVLALAGFLWWLHARHFEDTDDAQIDANITAVSSRVPGTVTAVHTDDNQQVKQGDLLIELDATDLQVALGQARAALAGARKGIDQRRAKLQQAETRSRETQTNAPRQLVARQAGLSVRQANLELAQAQLRQAELNFGYARITAPVAGIVGKRSVNVG